ncbi:MAG: hypothetical protein JWO85_289 [Candidatus Eremiobacteraeota bacterium]|jgi:hypothetical protein|nr:hypothetical protein [Candidatus Eremiobacteraeota bacterium]
MRDRTASATSFAMVALLLTSCTNVGHGSDAPTSSKTAGFAASSEFSSYAFDGSGSGGESDRLLTATAPVAAGRGGNPRVFRLQDIGKPGVPVLTLEMRSVIARVSHDLRPKYRTHLAFLFSGLPGQQLFLVFLEGYPRYPVLNSCRTRTDLKCSRVCPLYVDPRTNRVYATTMPTCTADLSIWAPRRASR